MVRGTAEGGERLDQFIAGLMPEFSRAACAKIIREGSVTVNGLNQTKQGTKLKAGDTVLVKDINNEVPESALVIEVLYEDNDCIVINKPTGILSHSKGQFNPEATVATWLKDKIVDMDGERAGIVHRLDRATSGVMICAKTEKAHKWLQKQFSQRRTKKVYSAVVEGTLKLDSALIDMPIERNPKKPQSFRVGVNGKTAQTQYHVVKSDGKYSLLELKPATGRTHQLRVHMQHLGHPILGDKLYGGKDSNRLYLHAKSLEITLPNKERRTFEVIEPPAFEEKLLND